MSDLTTSISQAMALATRLRSMSERLKEGEFKRLCDAILLELAEVQLKLDVLLQENASLTEQAKASPEGVCCPRCGQLGWKVTSTKPHKSPGVIAHTYACKSCGLKEEVLVKAK